MAYKFQFGPAKLSGSVTSTGVVSGSSGEFETALAVAEGGTGATTVAAARTALGLGDAAVKSVGISDGNVLAANDQVADDDFLRINGTEVEGLTVAEMQSALNFENGADVTDAANVTAAGALMDSEVTNLALVKGLTSGKGDGHIAQFTASVADSDFLRITSTGDKVEGLSVAEMQTALNFENGADVTDATNVQAAGALMDSEVTDLAGIKGVTISTLQVKPSEGAFADGDKTKLDAIEAGADVTDAANVTAAGALMDSEVTNLALVKGLTTGKGIGHIPQFTGSVADSDFLRITATGDKVEGRSASEVLSDIGAQAADDDLTALSSCQSGGAAALAALTSTEIAILDGASVSTAELNKLAGSANTSGANKMIILDANGDFEMQDSDKIFFGNDEDVSLFWDGDSFEIGTAASAPINIGNASSEVTVGDNLTVVGNLTVQGTTTTVESTTLTVADNNIVLRQGGAGNADGIGFTFGSTSNTQTLQTRDSGGTQKLGSSLPLSASAFYGDGSNLTNIAATDAVVSVDNDIADNATPQNIAGAGFHLWAGGSNDRIVHLSGTGGWIDGEVVYIKNANASNKLTIAPSGTDSIDGTAGQSIALETQGAAVTLIRKGTGWQIV